MRKRTYTLTDCLLYEVPKIISPIGKVRTSDIERYATMDPISADSACRFWLVMIATVAAAFNRWRLPLTQYTIH